MNTEEELYPLNLEGYRDLYSITKDCKIYCHTLKRFRKDKSYNSKGYPQVSLWRDNKSKSFAKHMLIALTFIPNDDPINKTIIHHIDGNKSNFSINNLIWLSKREHAKIHFRQDEKLYNEAIKIGLPIARAYTKELTKHQRYFLTAYCLLLLTIALSAE